MLPSGPRWKSHTLHPQIATKCKVVLYYHDPVECIQTLLSHPLFAPHISFVPQKVWSSSARAVRIYQEWLSGDHAWNLQVSSSFPRNSRFFFDLTKDQIPNGATLVGVVLSSDKTNISVMTGNRMAHPLLLSLANIDSAIRCKGSLHGHVLLMLLPVASFIHKKTRVCSLLSDRLVHECLDLVLNPLKIAAKVGIMMSNPVGNLRYCFTPLVAYIADTPEQCLLACISPKALPVSIPHALLQELLKTSNKSAWRPIRMTSRLFSRLLSTTASMVCTGHFGGIGRFLTLRFSLHQRSYTFSTACSGTMTCSGASIFSGQLRLTTDFLWSRQRSATACSMRAYQTLSR